MKFGFKYPTLTSIPLVKLLCRIPRGEKVYSKGQGKSREGINLNNGKLTDDKEQNDIASGIPRLRDVQVREIMVPRVDIAAIDEDTTVPDAIDVIVKQDHSYILLYKNTIDNIIGIIRTKDLLRVLHNGSHVSSLKEIAHPGYFIPESKKLSELLQEFQKRGTHLAVVVDEYGGTAGVVTTKDILEEIAEKLRDEYDNRETQMGAPCPTEATIDAAVTIDELNEMFNTDIKGEGFDTVGGLVFTQLGRIPTVGDKIEVGPIRVSVLSTLGKRIKSVKVNKI